MIDEYESAIQGGSAKTIVEHLREYALLVLTFPFLLLGFLAGCVWHFLKLCIGAAVVGYRRGYRGLIGA